MLTQVLCPSPTVSSQTTERHTTVLTMVEQLMLNSCVCISHSELTHNRAEYGGGAIGVHSGKLMCPSPIVS